MVRPSQEEVYSDQKTNLLSTRATLPWFLYVIHGAPPVLWAPSGSRRNDSRRCCDRDERGQPHFYEVEDDEAPDARNYGLCGCEA